jgi:aryl carrier-like protein
MPTPVPDPVDTIERFAELSARMEDPFADEEKVLREAGLDSMQWDAAQARWTKRISSSAADAEDLSRRFGAAYVAAKERLAGRTGEGVPPTVPDVPGFLSAEAQPWRAEAAAVGFGAAGEAPPFAPPPPPQPAGSSVADTLESGAPLPVPALPFRAPPGASPGDTLELGAVLPLPAMPFTR